MAAETTPDWRTRATASLLRRVLDPWGATWRWEPSAAEAGRQARERIDRDGPVIFASWHRSIMPFSLWLKRFVLPGHPLAVLSSSSKDGDIGALLAARWGARVVRGSSSRGGAAGARGMARLVREGVSLVLLVDGPRGPAFEAKPGAALLARLTGAPVLPVTSVAHRAGSIGSWDRMALPLPFSRVGIHLGEPVHIGRGEDLEAARLRVERALPVG